MFDLFKRKAQSRVNFLLGDSTTTPEYILFKAYFQSKIYSDIAYKLDVYCCGNISMENYTDVESEFSKPKEIRDNWKPSYKYFKNTIDC